MTQRHKPGARLLAAALVACSLVAPWVAVLAECPAPGCADATSFGRPHAQGADAGVPPCLCPSACASPPGGDCAQSVEPERESIVRRRAQGIRPGGAEPSPRTAVAFLIAGLPPAFPALPWRLARGSSSATTASASLFIRNSSLLR